MSISASKRLSVALTALFALLAPTSQAGAVELSVPGFGTPTGPPGYGSVGSSVPSAAGGGELDAGMGAIGLRLLEQPAGSPSFSDGTTPQASAPRAGGGSGSAAKPAAGAIGSSSRPSLPRAGATSSPSGSATGTGAGEPDPEKARTLPIHHARPPDARKSVVERIVNRIPSEFLAALCAAMLAAIAFAFVWIRERRRSRHARKEALVDALTGIANRLAFERRLSHEWRRAQRYGRPLGLLLLDLDNLKEINDRDGHAAGDRVLREVGGSISTDIRESDLAARLGGDEFVVLSPETSAEGLKQLAVKLWKRLEARGISTSIGRAELEPGDMSPEDLVARADIAMYRHKERRRVVRQGSESRRRREAAGQQPTAPPDLAISGLSAPRAS